MLSLIAHKFNLYEHQAQLNQEEVIISYRGPLNDVLLSEFGHGIRTNSSIPPKVSKKIFTVFMELAQNVLYYSQEINHFGEREPIGALIVLKNNDFYQILTNNLIQSKTIHNLENKCLMVNTLKRSALRDYKRELRNAPKEVESKGAGIGMVQAALVSQNPLEFDFKELDEDFAYYTIMAKVKAPKPLSPTEPES